MKEEIIQKIKETGIPQEEVENFYELLSENVLDLLFEDLADKLTDEELQVIENRIKEAKSAEHYETIIQELAITTYGENASQEINNMYLDLVAAMKKNIEDAKALLEKAQNGDPDAKKLLDTAMESDTYKSIMNQE